MIISGTRHARLVGLVDNCILLRLDHLTVVLVLVSRAFWRVCRGRGTFRIISSSDSGLILCSGVRQIFDWLTGYSVDSGRGRQSSQVSQSLLFPAFELLQLVLDLDFGVADLIPDNILLLLCELPGPEVLESD